MENSLITKRVTDTIVTALCEAGAVQIRFEIKEDLKSRFPELRVCLTAPNTFPEIERSLRLKFPAINLIFEYSVRSGVDPSMAKVIEFPKSKRGGVVDPTGGPFLHHESVVPGSCQSENADDEPKLGIPKGPNVEDLVGAVFMVGNTLREHLLCIYGRLAKLEGGNDDGG